MEAGLKTAAAVANECAVGKIQVIDKGGYDLITEVDRKISDVLREILLLPGEGWLSEEDQDNEERLCHDVVWVVDPLDGTREFLDGVPEWCLSVGLVVEGVAVAGGLYNPATDELFLGSLSCGVTYNKRPVQVGLKTSLNGAVVLASRQEFVRGEWELFQNKQFSIRPMGSIAYKLGLVSANLADATWTLNPKHEWDVAGGIALVNSAGGRVRCIGNALAQFNNKDTLLPGLFASGAAIWGELTRLLERSCREIGPR
jgi:myo-inositol-1(or 4)-monophosphatase